MHELLKRQVRKVLGSNSELPDDIGALLRLVDEAYRQADLDRELLERALELTSEELLSANKQLRLHAAQLEAKITERTADLERQIREREAAEAAHSEIDRRFRALAEHSPTGIFHSDAHGRTLYVNEAWCRITGLTREEAYGDGWRDAIHPDDRSGKVDEWQSLVDSGAGLRGGEYRLLRPNGDVVWVEGYAVPIHDEDGKVSGFVGSVYDISEHKLAQEIIRQSEERYRTLFEQSHDAIYISSPGGRFIDINPAGMKLLGFDNKDEILRTDISDLYLDRRQRQVLLKDLAEHGEVHERELSLRRTDGQPIVVLASITSVRDEEGMLQTMRGILRDVTETRLMEQQLRQGQKMEAVGRLAGGVAHDFNNLLTAIIGYADLLAMSLPGDTTLARSAEEIKNIAKRGAALTKQLLAFSRRQVVQPRTLELNSIVEEMRSLLGRLIGEDIELITDLDRKARAILADPTQIEQVIVNLAINARDAMPDGGKLTIKTDRLVIDEEHEPRHASLDEGPYVRLTVTDTGTGIDPEILDRIFEPFFTTKSDSQGTGLGLSTVYGAVQQSNGQIFVMSELGAGAIFEVLLPEAAKNEAKGEVETAQQRPSDGRGSETILIAEDEPTVRQFLASLLTSQGYRVLTASDGEEALEVAHAHSGEIDLLLSDVVMPRMNGIELAKRLRSEMSDLKVLLVTGYSENQQALREVGDAYLQKPFAPKILTQRLREMLDSAGSQLPAQ